MFRFVFAAEPTPGADQAADIAGGRIEVWVDENNAETAEAKARAYIMGYSWIVKELETSEHWPEELCPDPEKSAASFALHRKAERNGISALFQAWPKVPRPGVYEYRPLGDPLTPDGKQ
jgi:hypothetical protein